MNCLFCIPLEYTHENILELLHLNEGRFKLSEVSGILLTMVDIQSACNMNKAYTHFVVIKADDGFLIESGWEYASDAKDHLRENLTDDAFPRAKIFSRRYLKSKNFDPQNKKNWMKKHDAKAF